MAHWKRPRRCSRAAPTSICRQAGDKTTPLVIAINNGHFELAKFLLDHGADPNRDRCDGLAPLYATIDTEYAAVSWTPTRDRRKKR